MLATDIRDLHPNRVPSHRNESRIICSAALYFLPDRIFDAQNEMAPVRMSKTPIKQRHVGSSQREDHQR
jgi:hypothetical protein